MEDFLNKYVIKNEEDFSLFKNDCLNLFSSNSFPKSIFKPKDWGVLFFESWRIFNKDTFSHFQYFLEEINDDNKLFISPQNINNIVFHDYISSIKSKGVSKSDYPAILSLESEIDFESFNKVQKKFYYNHLNSFLFSSLKQWAFYTMPNVDLMILGYSPLIKDTVKKVYSEYSERIPEVDDVNELFIDMEGINISKELSTVYSTAFTMR